MLTLKKPLMLWLEPGSSCNLNCPGCPTASGRGGGVMRLSTFKTIIDRIPHPKLLNLWHRGEPLLAPEFPEMVSIATKQRIKTQTHTNGALLTRNEMAERIVDAGLTRISIAIDGQDEATYQKLRPGGTLAEVEAGIRKLSAAKARLNSRCPEIIAECLIWGKDTTRYREIKDLALKWGCEKVKFKTFRVGNPEALSESTDMLPENQRLWRYKIANGRLEMKRWHSHCFRLGFSALITFDGSVLPCCFDADAQFKMGNLLDQSWEEIWTGEAFNEFRRKVRKSRRTHASICMNCTEGLKKLYIPWRWIKN